MLYVTLDIVFHHEQNRSLRHVTTRSRRLPTINRRALQTNQGALNPLKNTINKGTLRTVINRRVRLHAKTSSTIKHLRLHNILSTRIATRRRNLARLTKNRRGNDVTQDIRQSITRNLPNGIVNYPLTTQYIMRSDTTITSNRSTLKANPTRPLDHTTSTTRRRKITLHRNSSVRVHSRLTTIRHRHHRYRPPPVQQGNRPRQNTINSNRTPTRRLLR